MQSETDSVKLKRATQVTAAVATGNQGAGSVPSRSAPPVSSGVGCPACGKLVDPLRAGEVALFGGQFVYFCARACKLQYAMRLLPASPEEVDTLAPPDVVSLFAPIPATAQSTAAPPVEPVKPAPAEEPLASRVLALADRKESASPDPSAVDRGALSHGGLAPIPHRGPEPNAEGGPAPHAGKAVRAGESEGARQTETESDLPSEFPATMRVPTFVSTPPASPTILAPRSTERSRMAEAPARRSVRSAPNRLVVWAPTMLAVALAPATFLRHDPHRFEAGLMAFMAVVHGGAVEWGLRSLRASGGRTSSSAPTVPMVRWVKGIAHWAPFGAFAILAGLGLLQGHGLVVAAFMGIGGALAANAPALVGALTWCYGRAMDRALNAGIHYRDVAAFDEAADAGRAVLCPKGTVLVGEPEVVTVEAFAQLSEERVLALAASADLVGGLVCKGAARAAQARGLALDELQRVVVRPGLGVTAMTASDGPLVVGSRALLLQEHIGGASADSRAAALEAQGRSVVLVALDGRVMGLVAFQDGLRVGARGAVQRLVDERIEPVILSVESRGLSEFVAKAIGVEHVRPEIAAEDVASEVRALGEDGNVVAVFGRPGEDDGALTAAPLAVALMPPADDGGVNDGVSDWSIVVTGDDLRDAVAALTLPKATTSRARRMVVVECMGAGLGVLLIALGASPVFGPLVGLAASGAVLALAYRRASIA